MKKLIVFAAMASFLLTGIAFAADKTADAKIKADCEKAAKAEKVPKDKMKEYIKKCIAEKSGKTQ